MLRQLEHLVPFKRNRFRQALEEALERVWREGSLDLEPTLDLEEHNDHYLLRVHVPRLGKDDLSVYLEGSTLVIEGERQETHERKRRVSEIYYGRIYHVLTLPQDVKPEGVKTRLRRGVLEVTLPRERLPQRRIVVEEG